MNKFIVLIVSLALSACSTIKYVSVPDKTEIIIPQDLLSPCVELNVLPEDASIEQILLEDLHIITEYNICKSRHMDLVDAIKLVKDKK